MLALAACLEDAKGYVRAAVARALGKQMPLPESVVFTLTTRLKDVNEDVRAAAARALGKQTPLPEPIVFASTPCFEGAKYHGTSAADELLENATLIQLLQCCRKTLEHKALVALADIILRTQANDAILLNDRREFIFYVSKQGNAPEALQGEHAVVFAQAAITFCQTYRLQPHANVKRILQQIVQQNVPGQSLDLAWPDIPSASPPVSLYSNLRQQRSSISPLRPPRILPRPQITQVPRSDASTSLRAMEDERPRRDLRGFMTFRKKLRARGKCTVRDGRGSSSRTELVESRSLQVSGVRDDKLYSASSRVGEQCAMLQSRTRRTQDGERGHRLVASADSILDRDEQNLSQASDRLVSSSSSSSQTRTLQAETPRRRSASLQSQRSQLETVIADTVPKAEENIQPSSSAIAEKEELSDGDSLIVDSGCSSSPLSSAVSSGFVASIGKLTMSVVTDDVDRTPPAQAANAVEKTNDLTETGQQSPG